MLCPRGRQAACKFKMDALTLAPHLDWGKREVETVYDGFCAVVKLHKVLKCEYKMLRKFFASCGQGQEKEGQCQSSGRTYRPTSPYRLRVFRLPYRSPFL